MVVRVYGRRRRGRLRGLVMVMVVHGRGGRGRVVMVVAHGRGVRVQGRGRRVMVTGAGAVAAHHAGQRQAAAVAAAAADTAADAAADAAADTAADAAADRALLLFRLGRQFPIARLYPFFFHRQRPVHLENRFDDLLLNNFFFYRIIII